MPKVVQTCSFVIKRFSFYQIVPLIFIFIPKIYFVKAALPIVLWHGIGYTCCDPNDLGPLINALQNHIPGTYVFSIQLGRNELDDMQTSYFVDVNTQINDTCKMLRDNVALSNGYNAVGFGQGGLLLRAVAQRCPKPQMVRLITFGSPHQGTYNFSYCPNLPFSCDFFRLMLFEHKYDKVLQESFALADYWHDPFQEELYRRQNIFLADINNERYVNMNYKYNLMRLQKLVLIQYASGSTNVPRETEWFGFYKPNQATEIIHLQNSRLYIEDRLGLRRMVDNNQVDFILAPQYYPNLTKEWFYENIINKYLS